MPGGAGGGVSEGPSVPTVQPALLGGPAAASSQPGLHGETLGGGAAELMENDKPPCNGQRSMSPCLFLPLLSTGWLELPDRRTDVEAGREGS